MTDQSKLVIETTGHGAMKLGYIGSVVDVLAARLPDALSCKRFIAADHLFGFELASPRDKNSLGEALIVNGICYATSSDNTSPDYNRTIFGNEFVTGGMFIIPPGAEPSHKCSTSADGSPFSLIDFYTELHKTVKQPLAFVGLAECASFHGTAIGKPPINGNAIFNHQSEYFPNPETVSNNVAAFVIGVLTDYENTELSDINKQLEVVLYKNPFSSGSGSVLSNHAHVLTLKQPVSRIDEITPDLVDKALHLFPDGTSLRSLRADVYTISSLIDYQDKNIKETS
ncbi:MAG: hypothetical protein HQM09_22455 [Candidatus Riflebacteria bacterium]|nr:hypothetical protein [Candidatus Riflebacteria bacterium]